MLARRVMAALAIAAIISVSVAGTLPAASVVITPGQLAPLNEEPTYALFGVGEGIEWVTGEETVWVAGVDLPPRAQLTSLIVYCLDTVGPNAMVQLFKVKGDGSPPQEIEAVVTGGTRDEPGTGFMANEGLRNEDRVDRSVYHYFVKAIIPRRPDDVRGILRINAIEVTYEK